MDGRKSNFIDWMKLKEQQEDEREKKPEKYDGPNEMSLDGLIKFLMAGSSEEPKKDYIGQYD
jgi:hypothetical protein